MHTPKHETSRESPPEVRCRSSNVPSEEDASAVGRLGSRGAGPLVGPPSVLRTQLSISARGVAFYFAVFRHRCVRCGERFFNNSLVRGYGPSVYVAAIPTFIAYTGA